MPCLVRTNDDDVELETALQELVLNLLRDGVKADVGVGTDLFSGRGGHGEDDGDREGGDEEDGWRWTTTALSTGERPNSKQWKIRSFYSKFLTPITLSSPLC